MTPGHTNRCDYTDDIWFSVSHVFQGYGPGMRYLTFEHGGVDSEYWQGHYGPLFDDASVILGP